MAMDEIDYELHGDDMQFVEIALDPGEAAIGEAGSMMYMEDSITMDSVFGDGSASQSGIFDKLVGAGKRLVTGESLFTTVYTNESRQKRKVAFAAPYTGRIIPFDLKKHGGQIICQKDAFLCAAKGVSLGIAFQKRLAAGFFGGEGFIMQRLDGDGLAFCHVGGATLCRTLRSGELLRVDTGCVVAYTSEIDFDIKYIGSIKTALFGGEGCFYAALRGPGKVWLQSLPFSRLASRIFAAAPTKQGGGGSDKGEGSLIGNILSGDRGF